MAFDTDCGVPTVLEAIRVASTAALVAQASRLHVQPGRLRYKTTRIGLSLRCRWLACRTAIPNS